MKRSKWTMIYWDLDPETGKLAPYIRLVPDFMDLEDAGYSHGLSLGGFRPDEADAKAFAESVDRFMEALVQEHGQEWPHVHICKFNESTFVWYDETEQPGGVETTFEAAKEALRKYGEQLEAEPAPAQDEREAFEAWAKLNHFGTQKPFANSNNYESGYTNFCWKAWQARATRPAQTEQQPAMTAELRQSIPVDEKTYFVHCNIADKIFVKHGPFFVSQGGLTEDWGKSWIRVQAESIGHARELGEELLKGTR